LDRLGFGKKGAYLFTNIQKAGEEGHSRKGIVKKWSNFLPLLENAFLSK
jgi:hypothetical protein